MRIFIIKYQGETVFLPEAEPEEITSTKGFLVEAQRTKKMLAFISVSDATTFFHAHNLKEQIEATEHIDVDKILIWTKGAGRIAVPNSMLNNLYLLMLDFYAAAYTGENENIPDSLDYPQLRELNLELFEQERYETVMKDSADKPFLLEKYGIRTFEQSKMQNIENSPALKIEVERLISKFLGVLHVDA